MSNETGDPLVAQTAHIGTFLQIAAADLVAPVVHHLGDGAHANATNSHDMERPNPARHLHRRNPLSTLKSRCDQASSIQQRQQAWRRHSVRRVPQPHLRHAPGLPAPMRGERSQLEDAPE